MKSNKVLVLLAARNGERWIAEQVHSIVSQKFVDVVIIAQDDCSSDDTLKLLVSLAQEKYSGKLYVKVASSPTGSAAGNFFNLISQVDAAGYDFIAFADQDDIWFENKIAIAIEALRSCNAAGYSAAVEAFWRNGKKVALMQNSNMRSCDFLFEGAGQGCTFVLPISSFNQIQDFVQVQVNEISKFHFHDWLMYLIIRAKEGQWIFDDRPALRYRQHGGNEIGSRGTFSSMKKRLFLIRNGWFKRQVSTAFELFDLAGGCSHVVDNFRVLFSSPDSIRRRIKISWFLLVNSRRRFSDRCILAASALAGWI